MALVDVSLVKVILNISGTSNDARISDLIPIIEDIAAKHCGVDSADDLSVGAKFPIIGLIKYAMDNPVGAKSQKVGNDDCEYGEFPNALLKLLDKFIPGRTGDTSDAECINLLDINEDLGI